ncbi:MAG: hypothetical protein C0467_13285 [Planctomycetaceae bacterium]|nr:hypothetical protein [Planctomycetaceae bacterium]
MAGRRFVRLLAAILGFTSGATVVNARQTPEIEAALRAQLLQLKQVQPKATPQPPAKSRPVSSAPSEGVIARLGDSRLRHAAKPLCVAFSPDGKRLFSGGEDGMVRVWETATGKSVKVLHTRDTAVLHMGFTHGGTQLAVQFADNSVLFLNPETLQEVSKFSGQFGTKCAISNNNRYVAHFGGSGLLRVTDLDTKLEQLELPVGSPYQFHPNNKTLAVANPKGVVTLYMLAGGKPVMTFDNGDKITSLAFSPDGKRVACGVGGVAKVWDIADGKTAKVIAEVEEAGRVGRWLDNNQLTVGGLDAAGVYDLSTKKWVGRAQGVAGEWAISPDGSRLAATGSGGLRIRLWDLATGTQVHAENDAFPESALLAPTADGKAVFVLAGENAFLWPLNKSTATLAGKLPGKAVLAASGKDRLAVAMAQGVLVYDNFDSAQPLATKPSRTITENAGGCRSLAVSSDGKTVAYSGDAAKIVIADATTAKTLRTLPVQTIAISLAFNPGGDKLATVGRDGFLRLSPTTGEEADLWKVRVQRGQRGSVAFSPDGKYIAATSSGLIKVVNTSDGSEVFAVGGVFENGLFQQVAFSSDGRFLIAASEGMTGGIRVWEMSTQSLVRQFTTGFGTVYRLGVFADGTRLVSAGAEEAITVWDLTGRHGKEAPKAELPKR